MVDIRELKNSIPKPNWLSWKNKPAITLNQALLLCLNVCPKWYAARDDKEKFLSNLTIWAEYGLRLEDARAWSFKADWVMDYLAREDLQEEDKVDLKNFIRWVCEDVEWHSIPKEFIALRNKPIKVSTIDIEEIKPIPKQIQQENTILEIISKLGVNPLKMAKVTKGKPGDKAKIRDIAIKNKRLFGSQGVFDKAWERLRSGKRISNEE